MSAGRGAELAALWQVVSVQRAQARNPRLEPLALLDLALGFFRRLPNEISGLATALREVPSGEGSRAYPELSRWLGDGSGDLDRLLAMQRLGGERPELSRRLRADHDATARLARQVQHLEGLPSRSSAQDARLARLRAAAGQPARGPGRTLRRLRVAADDAQRRAVAVAMERLARVALKALLGVEPPAIDQAWFDAVRLLGDLRENRSLLLDLLRERARGPRPAGRNRAENRAWLDRAAAHLSTEAWLRHHEWEVGFEGCAYTLATEEDPLQVLRMGIPFATCLSLGSKEEPANWNAAATVVNALDANKRVLYLRDARGAIVARKLIAISSRWELIGYRVYLALDPALRPRVETAFWVACEEIAAAAGVAMAPSGEPEQLHRGFWYDDGATAFAEASGAIDRYCELLGMPVLRRGREPLEAEAEAWAARERGDEEEVLRRLDACRCVGFWAELGEWLLVRRGEAEASRLARRYRWALELAFRESAGRSAFSVIEVLRRTRGEWTAAESAKAWALRCEPEPGSALAWMNLARRFASGGRIRGPTSGPVQGGSWVSPVLTATRSVLPWLASAETPTTRRDLAAEVEDVWERFGEPSPGDILDAPAPPAGEEAIVQARLTAQRGGGDGRAAAREQAVRLLGTASAKPEDGYWRRWDVRLASTFELLEETALELGPETAIRLLRQEPDAAGVAAFVRRILAAFPPGAVLAALATVEQEGGSSEPGGSWLRALAGREGNG